MKFTALCVAGIAIAAAAIPSAIPAFAHHSFAMFNSSQTATLEGTGREFQWTNPHAWIMLTVAKDGQSQDWAVEMMGPGGLARQGWNQKTLEPGMPVKLVIHPLRDGTNGGQFVEATLPDGTRMGRNVAQ
jgi:hypothetical protein